MAPHALVGRMVNVLTWDDLRDVLPDGPTGLVTHVAEGDDGDVEITVRINGLSRNYVFDLTDVEVLPCPTDGASHAANVDGTPRLPPRAPGPGSGARKSSRDRRASAATPFIWSGTPCGGGRI